MIRRYDVVKPPFFDEATIAAIADEAHNDMEAQDIWVMVTIFHKTEEYNDEVDMA